MKYWLVALFFISRAADYLSTYAIFRMFPFDAREVNPLANWFLQTAGWAGMAAYGGILSLICMSLILYACRSHRPRTGMFGLVTVCVISSSVVVHNIALICGLDVAGVVARLI